MPAPSTTIAAARLAPRLLAAALALTPLAGCSFGSDNVSCTTSSCTATLSGQGATAEVLGQTVTFGGTDDGRATISVAGASVSCGEGETVAAGPFSVQCTGVSTDAVEITATLN